MTDGDRDAGKEEHQTDGVLIDVGVHGEGSAAFYRDCRAPLRADVTRIVGCCCYNPLFEIGEPRNPDQLVAGADEGSRCSDRLRMVVQ